MVTKEIKSFARIFLAAALLLSAAWPLHSQNPAAKGQKPVRVVPSGQIYRSEVLEVAARSDFTASRAREQLRLRRLIS